MRSDYNLRSSFSSSSIESPENFHKVESSNLTQEIDRKEWIVLKYFAAGDALLAFFPPAIELLIKLLSTKVFRFPFLACPVGRESKIVIHVTAVEVPETHAHAKRGRFIAEHLAHRTILINDHIAWTECDRQALAFIVDQNGGNTAAVIGLWLLEPVGLEFFELGEALFMVSGAGCFVILLEDLFGRRAATGRRGQSSDRRGPRTGSPAGVLESEHSKFGAHSKELPRSREGGEPDRSR